MADDAIGPIADLIDGLTDFRNDDGGEIQSAGGRTLIQHLVGEGADAKFEWQEFEHTNLVVARWLLPFARCQAAFQGALGVTPTAAPQFDATRRLR